MSSLGVPPPKYTPRTHLKQYISKQIYMYINVTDSVWIPVFQSSTVHDFSYLSTRTLFLHNFVRPGISQNEILTVLNVYVQVNLWDIRN